jgi:hypothetical protein
MLSPESIGGSETDTPARADAVRETNQSARAVQESMNNARIPRRSVLRRGATLGAIGAGSVLLRPQPANATTTALELATENDASDGSTGLTSANATDTLHITNDANAPALQLRSGGAALVTEGRIEAAPIGEGDALHAHIDSDTNTGIAILAATAGLGEAVHATVTNPNSTASAVSARTSGTGIAINGASAHGIGGHFSGATAQIQLVPSSASTHPVKGSAGMLFVDRSHRLWFCRGGEDWHRLA